MLILFVGNENIKRRQNNKHVWPLNENKINWREQGTKVPKKVKVVVKLKLEDRINYWNL